MSYYAANLDELLGQFASNKGYDDLIQAAAGSRCLSSFFHHGVTRDVQTCVAELDKLALAVKDDDIATTATALANLIQHERVAVITNGVVNGDRKSEDEAQQEQAKADLNALYAMLPQSTVRKLRDKSLLRKRYDLAKRNTPKPKHVEHFEEAVSKHLDQVSNQLAELALSLGDEESEQGKVAKDWDEAKHPRVPAGSGPESGRFASGGEGEAAGTGQTEHKRGDKFTGPIDISMIPVMTDVKLTPEEREVETRFRQQIANDPEAAKAAYRATYGNRLSADDAKELSPDYKGDPNRWAAAVHEPSSWLVKEMYAEDLRKPAPEGKENTVFFSAGGPGAGKTSGLKEGSPEMHATQESSHIVYDSTLSGERNAKELINAAHAAGKDVVVAYVHRDPADAMMNGVVPRAKGGEARAVPLAIFAKSHSEIQGTMKAISDKYSGTPGFRFAVFDNSYGKGNARESSLDKIARVGSKAEIHESVGRLLTEAHDAGDPKVNDKVFATIMQKDPAPGLWRVYGYEPGDY